MTPKFPPPANCYITTSDGRLFVYDANDNVTYVAKRMYHVGIEVRQDEARHLRGGHWLYAGEPGGTIDLALVIANERRPKQEPVA